MIKISRKAISKWIKANQISLHPLNELKVRKFENLNPIQLEVSQFVRKAFSETLDINIDEIGLESHFMYDLGGTSLDYLTLIAKLKEKYDFEYVIDESNYTVYEFTTYIIKNNEE